MYIGNIVTDSKIEYENFKIYRNLEDINDDLPTLIIGWGKVKELFGDTISILHKKISNKVFWTFNPKEKKSEYEIDLEDFISYCYNFFGENIPYIYLDILYGKKNVNSRIIRKILTLENPVTYFSPNGMVYIYGENLIFGVDLNIIDLFEGKREKIEKTIKDLTNNTLVDYEIFNKCKDLIYKIKNKNRYVPYIYSNGIKQ